MNSHSTEPNWFDKLLDSWEKLPTQTKLAAFLLFEVVAALAVLRSLLDGWQAVTFALLMLTYSAFSVWIHRPDHPTPPTSTGVDPPAALLDVTALGELANQPMLLLITINAAAAVLREHIRDTATHVRGLKKHNSESDVSRRLQQLLGQPEPIVRALLKWADQKP